MTHTRTIALRWLATVGFSLLLATVFVALAGWLAFGSAYALPALATGQVVVVDKSVIDVGTVAPGETRTIAFTIRNVTSRAIPIVGARLSCSCVRPVGLPIEIPPGAQRQLVVRVRPSAGQAGKRLRQSSELILGSRGITVPLTVVVNVRDRSTRSTERP
jgi:hypothetical protein